MNDGKTRNSAGSACCVFNRRGLRFYCVCGDCSELQSPCSVQYSILNGTIVDDTHL